MNARDRTTLTAAELAEARARIERDPQMRFWFGASAKTEEAAVEAALMLRAMRVLTENR